MRNRLWIVSVVVFIGVSSCNMPTSQTTEMPASALTPVLDTPTSSSATPMPILNTGENIELPTVTPSSTPGVILASAKDQPVNCRFGQGRLTR